MAQIQKVLPDRAEALQRQVEDSQNLIKQMVAMRNEMRLAPKADAAQRVARIKEEIRILETVGGDPKIVARRIAQLARELAMATKTYAAASRHKQSQDSAAMPMDETVAESASGSTDTLPATQPLPEWSAVTQPTRLEVDSEAKGDRDFRDQVRTLATKLKALASKVARQLKVMGERDNPELVTTKHSLYDVEKTIHQIASLIGNSAGISVFA
jgi:hypothetical protein